MTAAPTRTARIVRVERTVYFDAKGTQVFFLRVPEGVTDGDIEDELSSPDFEFEPFWVNALDCGAKVELFVDYCDGDIEESLETTGGVDVDEFSEVSEAGLAFVLKKSTKS